jgi:hypothetical protein
LRWLFSMKLTLVTTCTSNPKIASPDYTPPNPADGARRGGGFLIVENELIFAIRKNIAYENTVFRELLFTLIRAIQARSIYNIESLSMISIYQGVFIYLFILSRLRYQGVERGRKT